MRATEVLKQEHRLIEQVLDCLERIAAEPVNLDRQAAASAVEFLVDYADRRHHGKEEDLLFTAMGEQGIPTDIGPIGVMLAEHTIGRKAIAEMRAALETRAEGSRTRFAVAARDYVMLLREHIEKEDHILYPLANDAFDDAVEARLAAAFAALEERPGEDRARAHDLEIADRLAAQFGVARAADRGSGSFPVG
jgi:hemerythrin-like domain-containing protein